MRRSSSFSTHAAWHAIAVAISLAAGAALAEPRPFEGTLTFRIGMLYPIEIKGSGTIDLTTGQNGFSIQRAELAGGEFSETAITQIADPRLLPIAGVRASLVNEPATFERSAPGAPLRGVMPFSGLVKVCLFVACDQGPLANLTFPLSVVGTDRTATVEGAIDVTVRGAPWTTGVISTPTVGGYGFPVEGGTSYHNGRPSRLRLVTPIFIASNLGSSPVIRGHASLDLSYAYDCSDGYDNDNDNRKDYPSDPGCSSPEDPDEHSPTLACDDGIDNDLDLRSDYYAPYDSYYPVSRDRGCESFTDPSELDACGDGLDNDGDGRIDMADSGCADPGDASEYALPACNDLADNDRDGTIDLATDPGCESASDEDERGSAVCDDGIDQDGDGVADLPSDPGCATLDDVSEQESSVACDDGEDDDGDGLIDSADPGCVGSLDPDEHASVTACDDGIDQDGDLLVDFPADGDCASADDGIEGADVAACQNGIDDDADGLVDGVDPACDGAEDLEEAVLLADGALHTIDGPASLPVESLRIADGPAAAPTTIALAPDGVVGHRLVATQHSIVSVAGGTLGGDLFAVDQAVVTIGSGAMTGTIRTEGAASVEVRGGSLVGAIEARGASRVTIVGWIPNRARGAVPQLGGTITGTLLDGTPVNLAFLREPSATIAIPEPDAAMALATASIALAILFRRRDRVGRG